MAFSRIASAFAFFVPLFLQLEAVSVGRSMFRFSGLFCFSRILVFQSLALSALFAFFALFALCLFLCLFGLFGLLCLFGLRVSVEIDFLIESLCQFVQTRQHDFWWQMSRSQIRLNSEQEHISCIMSSHEPDGSACSPHTQTTDTDTPRSRQRIQT